MHCTIVFWSTFATKAMSTFSNTPNSEPDQQTGPASQLSREKRTRNTLAEEDQSAGSIPGDPIVRTQDHKGCVVHYLSTVPQQTHDPALLMYSNHTLTTACGSKSDWLNSNIVQDQNEGKTITQISSETNEDGTNFKSICHPPPVPNGLFRINPEPTPISIEMEYASKEVLMTPLRGRFRQVDTHMKVDTEHIEDAACLFRKYFPQQTKYEHQQSFNLMEWMTDGPFLLKSDAATSSSSSSSSTLEGPGFPGYLKRKKQTTITEKTKYMLVHGVCAEFHSSDTAVNFELTTATPSCMDPAKNIEWVSTCGKIEDLGDWREGTAQWKQTPAKRDMYPLITKHSADRSTEDANFLKVFAHEDPIWLHRELSWWLTINPEIMLASLEAPYGGMPGHISVGSTDKINVMWYVVEDDCKEQSFPVWFWLTRRTEVTKDFCAACKLDQADYVSAFANKKIVGAPDENKQTETCLVPIPTILMQYLIGRVYTEFDLEKLLMPVTNKPDFHVVTKLPKGPIDIMRVAGLPRQPNIEFNLKLSYQYFDSPWTPQDVKVKAALGLFREWGESLQTLQQVADAQNTK
jgi:hypothetical protein